MVQGRHDGRLKKPAWYRGSVLFTFDKGSECKRISTPIKVHADEGYAAGSGRVKFVGGGREGGGEGKRPESGPTGPGRAGLCLPIARGRGMPCHLCGHGATPHSQPAV